MSKKVLLTGPGLCLSGYGTHFRQIIKWIFSRQEEYGLDIQCNVTPWGDTPFLLDNTMYDGLIGKIMKHTKDTVSNDYDIALSCQLPNEWNPTLAKFNIGVTAGVETDKCNPTWIDCINKMSLVIVPSEFTKQCFLNSGSVTTDIVVIPESFVDEVLDETIPALDIDFATPFNFLVFGQFTGNNPENDRKNLAYTAKWFSETFNDNPSVGIVYKTNMSRMTKYDKLQCMNTLTKLLLEVKTTQHPKFYLLHGDMTEREIVGLYKHPKIKCLLSLSRGEGFFIPGLEAAGCGLPVLATGWSAHTEYLGLGKYIKFDYKLDSIHASRVDNQIFMEGAKWATPLEQDVKHRLKKFYEEPELPTQWAKELKGKIQQNYSFFEISKKYDEVLGLVLKGE
jgi:hypothetical protein